MKHKILIIMSPILVFLGVTARYGHCLGNDEEWQKEKDYWRDFFGE